MNWLKGLGKSVLIAIGVFLAAMGVMAATRQASQAEKWKQKAIDIEGGNVVKGVETATAALTQAKKHDAKAAELKAKATAKLDKVGQTDEETAVVLDRWRKKSPS